MTFLATCFDFFFDFFFFFELFFGFCFCFFLPLFELFFFFFFELLGLAIRSRVAAPPVDDVSVNDPAVVSRSVAAERQDGLHAMGHAVMPSHRPWSPAFSRTSARVPQVTVSPSILRAQVGESRQSTRSPSDALESPPPTALFFASLASLAGSPAGAPQPTAQRHQLSPRASSRPRPKPSSLPTVSP